MDVDTLAAAAGAFAGSIVAGLARYTRLEHRVTALIRWARDHAAETNTTPPMVEVTEPVHART